MSLVYSPLLSRYLSGPQARPLLRVGLLSLLLLLPEHAQAAWFDRCGWFSLLGQRRRDVSGVSWRAEWWLKLPVLATHWTG